MFLSRLIFSKINEIPLNKIALANILIGKITINAIKVIF